jgi:hypothetical protein
VNKFFVITPPRERRAKPSGSLDALLYLLWQCVAVHGFLLLISWAVFLAASPSTRFLIVAGWAVYIALAIAFVNALIAERRR